MNHRLWYDRPAKNGNEALPVGNGRLGALVFGRVQTETLPLNEDTIWYGGPKDRINPDALAAAPEIRRLLLDGHVRAAERLAKYAIPATPRQQYPYQPLGVLTLEMLDHDGPAAGYRRELDLDTAIARVTYTRGGTQYVREIFSSAVAQALVCRLTCAGPGSLSFGAFLGRRPFEGESGRLGGDRITMTGQVGPDGPRYAVLLHAAQEGGTLRALGDSLLIEEARSVTLLLAAGTTYYGSRNPGADCRATLETARTKGYERLRADHIADHQRYYRRVTLDLGNTDLSHLPTDKRLERLRGGADDPGLVADYFQYGRYLLLSSSRPGTLAANLQGIWNESMTPPWECKYTININIPMNYWPAEVCNLAECHGPLFDLLDRARVQGHEVAKRMYGCRGFCLHTNTTAWGDATPQGPRPSIFAWTMGGAWLATHLWEHYLFGRDERFLRERAYPVLKECAQFIVDYLQEMPDGDLVTGPSASPENDFVTPDGYRGGLCLGATIDMALAREILDAAIAAGEILGTDPDLRRDLRGKRARLAPYRIGKHGQLQEWREDYDEADPGHRHVSHLLPLHPGRQFTVDGTPELAGAARASLRRRLEHGGGQTGWSAAWLANLFARLRDGDSALKSVRKMLTDSTFPNLLVDAHGQVQIDGTFGATAGVAEMLVQSHNDEIDLLPALPAAWPDGSVTGLRARGGFEIDIAWRNGVLTKALLRSQRGLPCRIRCGDRQISFLTTAGEAYQITENLERG